MLTIGIWCTWRQHNGLRSRFLGFNPQVDLLPVFNFFFPLLKVLVIQVICTPWVSVKTKKRNIGFPIFSLSVKELLYTIYANMKIAVFLFASNSQVQSRDFNVYRLRMITQTHARASYAKPNFYLLHNFHQFKFTCVSFFYLCRIAMCTDVFTAILSMFQSIFSYAC